jgi:hypothetical protein
MRLGGGAQFVLLVAAAWVAGLTIAVMFTLGQPAPPVAHAGVPVTPPGSVVPDTAGRRWGTGADGQITAGRRWTSSPWDGRTAGRRWTSSSTGGMV